MHPFGPGNPEPLFAFSGMRVVEAIPMKGGHVRVVLADPDGTRIRAVAWRAGEGPMGKRLMEQGGGLNVAGKLRADDWNGRNGVQLEIEDIADPRMAV